MTKAEQILAYARQHIGKPYRLGSAGPDLWDCSGLTLKSVRQIGYIWYHGATTQWNRGLGIKDAKCRDLPTWLGYWSASGTIDTLPNKVAFLFHQDDDRKDKLIMAHTGIYDGRGQVVQAGGQYKGVSDKPLNKKRWSHWATLKGVDEVADETRVLKYTQPYMRGDDVRHVQGRLIALGYGVGVKGADGVYGNDTSTAVKVFQAERGLIPDGEVGASTLAALNATTPPIGSGTTPPTPLQVDLLTAELDALKIAINALYAHVDKIITMVRG